MCVPNADFVQNVHLCCAAACALPSLVSAASSHAHTNIHTDGTAECIEECVAAAKGTQCEVYVDGGVRRGKVRHGTREVKAQTVCVLTEVCVCPLLLCFSLVEPLQELLTALLEPPHRPSPPNTTQHHLYNRSHFYHFQHNCNRLYQ